MVSDGGFALSRMSKSVPDLEGSFRDELSGDDPPFRQGRDPCVRIFLLDLSRRDLDWSDISVMSVHQKDLIDTVSQDRFHDIIDHMDHGLIIKG